MDKNGERLNLQEKSVRTGDQAGTQKEELKVGGNTQTR